MPMRRGSFMHEELWAGVALKLQYAAFHLLQMERSLEPPEQTAIAIVLEASGAIIDTGWERSFYAHLDAFLSAARSVPEIIQCCFGEDLGHREMKEWFRKLPGDEQDRRHKFKKEFETHYANFRALRLSTARNISAHRTFAPATVTISGRFGVTYIGNPAQRVPISETPQIADSALAFLAKPKPVRPEWDDFDIEGQPLFPACRDYLNAARSLMDEARRIVLLVHGTQSLSFPPT